jgi:hypothetical protein
VIRYVRMRGPMTGSSQARSRSGCVRSSFIRNGDGDQVIVDHALSTSIPISRAALSARTLASARVTLMPRGCAGL